MIHRSLEPWLWTDGLVNGAGIPSASQIASLRCKARLRLVRWCKPLLLSVRWGWKSYPVYWVARKSLCQTGFARNECFWLWLVKERGFTYVLSYVDPQGDAYGCPSIGLRTCRKAGLGNQIRWTFQLAGMWACSSNHPPNSWGGKRTQRHLTKGFGLWCLRILVIKSEKNFLCHFSAREAPSALRRGDSSAMKVATRTWIRVSLLV